MPGTRKTPAMPEPTAHHQPPARRGTRPTRLVAVCGTGTEVGKTWVAAAVLRECRRRDLPVAARKPAQSFAGDAPVPESTDAAQLAAASGEEPDDVCPPHRSFGAALAPPMAAESLGRPAFTVDDLVAELCWPDAPVAMGVVELAGGLRSPQADDGDGLDLLVGLEPDAVVLVADAGLGTLNAVRLSLEALATLVAGDGPGPSVPAPVFVVLDRFDGRDEVHRRNRAWLSERDGDQVFVVPGQEVELVDALLGA